MFVHRRIGRSRYRGRNRPHSPRRSIPSRGVQANGSLGRRTLTDTSTANDGPRTDVLTATANIPWSDGGADNLNGVTDTGVINLSMTFNVTIDGSCATTNIRRKTTSANPSSEWDVESKRLSVFRAYEHAEQSHDSHLRSGAVISENPNAVVVGSPSPGATCPGATPTPSPTPSPVLQIMEQGVTQPVSDGNVHNSVIGKQMVITAALASPAPAGPYQWHWSIPGAVVLDYRLLGADSLTQPGAAPLPYQTPAVSSASSTESTTFYWVTGNQPEQAQTLLVTVTAADGTTVKAAAFYNVEAPTITSYGADTQPVNVGTYVDGGPDSLNLGTQLSLPTSAGIFTTAKGFAPPDYGGLFSFTQTIDYTTFEYPHDTKKPPVVSGTNQATWIDGCTLYTTDTHGVINPRIDLFLPAGQPLDRQTVDAPTEGLPADERQVTTSNSFVTYLMFHPSVPSAIWVPLANFAWVFNGTAAEDEGNHWYRVSYSTNPAHIAGAASPVFPTWTGAVAPPPQVDCVTAQNANFKRSGQTKKPSTGSNPVVRRVSKGTAS